MSIEAPLSFGQLYSWREVESYPQAWRKEANLPGTWDLRGCSLDLVESALQRLFEWHEPLRTSYRVQDGVPVQRIHDDVALPIERVDRAITDMGDPERTTADLVAIAFPMTDELCWSGVLVTTDGAPMFLSLSFSHLILDVWSTIELQAQFRAIMLDPGSPDLAERVGPSPQVLARLQRDDSAQARQDGADRYWRRVLSDESTYQLPTLPSGAERNRIQATLHSRRLGVLAANVAKTHGVTPPAVLMALVAAGLAKHTGAERIAMSLMSSNRFSPKDRHIVGTMNQLIPVVVSVEPNSSLAEHITRLHWAGAKAYRYSCYDVDRVAALAEDGSFNNLFQCWFNYLQLDSTPLDPTDETAAELVWTPVARQYGQPFDVRVSVQQGRTSVALRVDPDVISADGLTDILRRVALGVERTVLDPHSNLADLMGDHAAAVSPQLWPLEVPAAPDQPAPLALALAD